MTTQRPMELKLEAAIDRAAAGGIQLSAKEGMVLQSMGEAMEFAKLMSLAREGVRKHCRENPGLCLSICIQAMEWQVNPLALANKSYVVNDQLCYEAALYQTIIARRAPIVGRIKMEFAGESEKRTCRVWAELADGTGSVEYTSPPTGRINPKNSPLWKNDPDQQLFYFSVRSFARRHFPDVMMGVYTVDEMLDAVETVRTVDTRPKADRMAERLVGSQSVATTTREEPQDAATIPDATQAELDAAPEQRPLLTCEELLAAIEQAASTEDVTDLVFQRGHLVEAEQTAVDAAGRARKDVIRKGASQAK